MAGKPLVAVFSASGVTKKAGEEIDRIAGADFFEIVPKGNVEWKKGTQINRPDETVIKKWLEEVL